ncbi:MAG: N-acetylmuramoyl-L-alanine amidase [Fimbriimonadaceae bacterium]
MTRAFFVVVLSILGRVWAQTICIDPGHPSENGIGTRGKKTTEVGVAWEVAKRLKLLLDKEGYEVVLTKSSEREHITNASRAGIANRSKAAFLLRLHCDAGTGSGLASYYPGEVGRVGNVSGPSAEIRAESKKLAEKFHMAVIKSLKGKLRDAGLMTDRKTKIGGKQGALTGSILSKVPVVLVEMCVLQNPKDEAFIATAAGKDAMAKALFAGIKAAVPRNRK